MGKKLMIISFLVIILLFFSLFLLLNNNNNNDNLFLNNSVELNQSNFDKANNFPQQLNQKIISLKIELTNVLKINGEINAKRYVEIEKILQEAEQQNYSYEKLDEISQLLKKFKVVNSSTSSLNPLENNGLLEKQKLMSSQDEEIDSEDLVIWHYNLIDWIPSHDPPKCSNPFIIQSPVNLELATSNLYPGQIRGGNYKSHGGFRFDNSDNELNVYAPFDGFLWRANRFIQKGEVQYQLDVTNPCGMMFRLDHLRTLPDNLMKIISLLPEPREDTLSTSFNPVPIKKGELMATSVGMDGNVFMDIGIYDLRKKNNLGPDPYALCWFKLLPAKERELVESLPGADFESGQESDYC